MLLHDDQKTETRRTRPLAFPFPPALRAERSRLLTAFSLANLCFINAWYLAEQVPGAALDYYRKTPPQMTILWATLISVLLLGAAFWTGWHLVRRLGNPVAVRFGKGLFLIVLSYPVEKLIRYLTPPSDQFSYTASTLLIVCETTLLMGVMLVVVFRNESIFRVARSSTLVLALLFPSLLFNLTWMWASSGSASAFADRPLAGPVADHKPAASRVIWMIFDEMDQGLAFDYRHPSVRMPNLDRLRAQSFYADRVRPTARWTMLAIPALLGGRALSRAELMNASDLRIWPQGQEQSVSWRDEPNVFSRARAQGRNTAILGWHHPYCRVLNNSLSSCYWESSDQGGSDIELEAHMERIGLFRSVLYLLEWKMEDVVSALNIHFRAKSSDDILETLQLAQTRLFGNIRQRALAMTADPQLDLVVVHWPAPHPYGIFDPRTNDFSTRRDLGYLDNLALVDRTIGEVRAGLEKSGLDGRTTLLISSDHPFRREVWWEKFRWPAPMIDAVNADAIACVPFVVSFGADRNGASYHEPFNAVLTAEIAGRILDGRIASASGLAEWLDSNRTSVPLD